MKFSVTKKDFEVTWFSGTGGGGQHRNKHMNCCRIKHKATGIITTGQEHRERGPNQKLALERMAKNKYFLAYCENKLREMENGETMEEWVNKQLAPDKIKTEVKDENGQWMESDEL